MGIRLFSALMIVGAVTLIGLPGKVFADEQLGQAIASLEQKKYKQAVQFAGKTLATAKQKPDIMAKALLTRGVAYRAQGKYAQAIADFSNAEWLRKLSKEDLRALYAERALAYEAVGQAKLAAKDRKTASSNLLKGASSRKSIVKSTGLKPKDAPVQTQQQSTDFFGGLGNLFGFNNNTNTKKVETASKIQTPVAQNKTPVITSGGELAAKMGGDANKKIVVAKKTTETAAEVKTNSAWAAQRIAEDKKLEAARIIEAAKNREAAKKLKASQKKLAQNRIPPKPVIKASELEAPVKLTPVEPKTKGGGNVVTNFFDSLFGGGQQKTPPPVPPAKEQDVIVADQVATEKPPAAKKVATSKRPVKVVKKPVKVALAKPVEKKVVTKRETAARSLYHLQLGAFGEAAAADQFVDRLNKNYKKIVGSKVAMVVETDLGNNRRQYKVYLGPYRDRQKSISSCKAFKQVGLGCSLLE